jgi:hypothetical protein
MTSCFCKDAGTLQLALSMEKLKCKIYKQILEQKLSITLEDDVEELISGVVERFVTWEHKKRKNDEDEQVDVEQLFFPRKIKKLKEHPSPSYMKDENENKEEEDEDEDEEEKSKTDDKDRKKIFVEEDEDEEFLDFDNCEDDDEQEVERDLPRQRGQNNAENEKKLNELFSALVQNIQTKSTNSHNSILCEIRQLRFAKLELAGVHEFIKTVQTHLQKIKTIFAKKGFSEAKIINNILPISFSPLEYRILMLDNLQKQTLEPDEICKFKSCLLISYPQEFSPFRLENFTNFLLTYAIAFTSLQDLVNSFFSHSLNIIFVQHQPEEDFAFYTLQNVSEGEIKHWSMDCRLENLTLDMSEIIINYCVELFRNLYKKCLGTNNHVFGYVQKCSVLEFECEQLLETIFTACNFHKLNRLFQNSVNFYAYDSSFDRFDLKKEDRNQLENFKSYAITSETIENILHRLFDDIDKETEKSFCLRYM